MSRYFVQEVYGKRFSGVNPSQIQSIPSAWVIVVMVWGILVTLADKFWSLDDFSFIQMCTQDVEWCEVSAEK